MSENSNQKNHRIPFTKAKQMIQQYRKKKDSILIRDVQGKDILPLHETFSRQAIEELLAQPDCQGLRIYYSMDTDLKLHAVLFGVNANDQTISKSSTTSSSELNDDAVILDEAHRCPPICPEDDTIDD